MVSSVKNILRPLHETLRQMIWPDQKAMAQKLYGCLEDWVVHLTNEKKKKHIMLETGLYCLKSKIKIYQNQIGIFVECFL